MSLYSTHSASIPSKIAGILIYCGVLAAAQTPAATDPGPMSAREHALLDRIENLEKRVTALEGKATVEAHPLAAAAPIVSTAAAANTLPEDATKHGILGLPGTTLNFYFDGHYGWNFNRPVGGVNLLRANDVQSNNSSRRKRCRAITSPISTARSAMR